MSRAYNALLKKGRERNGQRFGRLQDEIANRQVFGELGSPIASISGNLDGLLGTYSTNNKINTTLFSINVSEQGNSSPAKLIV